MTTRIILDTDIGTDVDDCLALALLLCSPEISLEGVTCVYGDVELRARMVRKLLQLRDYTNVPVLMGVSQPLLRLRSVYWEDHEGQGLLEPEDDEMVLDPRFAPDYIIQMVMENPGQIHLAAIGPLTNIAQAILKEPRIAHAVAGITIMGGVVRGMSRLELPVAEHNIVCDPEAAHIVFSSGAPITLVPLDLTTQVRVDKAGCDRIRSGGTLFHHAVAGQLDLYPRFQLQGWTNLHDPLAVAILVDPSLVQYEKVVVEVETSGRLSAGATLARLPRSNETANVRLATSVDVARFEAFFIERLER
ncbi:MAG: nucleoside hydrolase [Anaerolineae bacterium]